MAEGPQKYASDFSPLPGRLNESDSERRRAPLTLMLLGKTGNGKSSFGNALLGVTDTQRAPFQQKSGMVACQDYDPIIEEGKILEHKVSIIDTPGVLDNVKTEQAVEGICRAIFLCPSGVTAFVIVLRADSRFTDEESLAVTQLQSLFGDKFWKHAICVFTHGDAALRAGREAFDDSIKQARKQLPNLNKLMASVGNRVMLVNCDEMGSKERKEFVLLLDSIRNKNMGENYTDTLFKEAQPRYKNSEVAEMIVHLCRAKSELRKLEALQSSEAQEEISKLKKEISACEVGIKKLQDKGVEDAKPFARRRCIFL